MNPSLFVSFYTFSLLCLGLVRDAYIFLTNRIGGGGGGQNLLGEILMVCNTNFLRKIGVVVPIFLGN